MTRTPRKLWLNALQAMELPDGLYDKLISLPLAQALDELGSSRKSNKSQLDPEEAPERLANALAGLLTQLLDDIASGGDESERAMRQIALVNDLLGQLRKQAGLSMLELPDFDQPPQILRAIHPSIRTPSSPETGLALPWLFTAGKGTPSLLNELRHELSSCDQVDILVSFITVSGVRKLFDILQSATAVDSQNRPRTRVRVLTTTYTGATELEAIDYLARLAGCELKVSLDGRRTRLHAKAWLFHRVTGFGCAYVGSANLSGAALLGGLEWTVKFTEHGQAAMFARAKAHFESLWNDSEFQAYDPDNADHRAGLSQALRREAGEYTSATTTFFDLQPKDYQRAMLEQLAVERHHGRTRNLIVAATGTGKTVVAAFDYRATCLRVGGHPRLLFVSHRREILQQAMKTYREVLRDHGFGEFLADGAEPVRRDHLFATIDSVCARRLVAECGQEFWHTVVVDECHRLAANRFDEFVRSVRPQILLGLTATPERSDGKAILPYFENRLDGSPAVELRLWHALDLQLLCPFEYYGCDDTSDFSEVPWDKPGEREALDRVVTGNDVRAKLVLDEWRRLTANPRQTKTIAFCVSVAHAEFMTRCFNDAGLPAVCVVGATDPDVRRRAPQRLASGEVCALVTCDLYNEGVDLPSVDTLLLLRPTQSPVLFQQQIGRGLRLFENKQSCLVLDFVGRHRVDFRFDRLFSMITGLSRSQLVSAVETGFSTLPPGCHIQLQPLARAQVLQSLRSTISQSWRRVRTELQGYVALHGRSAVVLADFLREQALEPEEIYRDSEPSGWTALCRDVGVVKGPEGPEDGYFGRRFAALLHVEDPEQIDLLRKVSQPSTLAESLTETERRRLQMFAYQVDGQARQVGSGEAFLHRLAACPALRSELRELADVLHARAAVLPRSIPGLEDLPLCLHAGYEIREILTAVGWLTAGRRPPFQAGVLALPGRKVELFFVTLDKSKGYHDRIAYHDYAISPERFHWQSQNAAGPRTAAGRRYLESPGNGWSFQLFVRREKGDPYRACGPLGFQRAEGEKPMSIEWKLECPLPVGMFQELSILRAK